MAYYCSVFLAGSCIIFYGWFVAGYMICSGINLTIQLVDESDGQLMIQLTGNINFY